MFKNDVIPGIKWDNPDLHESTNSLSVCCYVQTWGEFKPNLAEIMIAHLEPIQTKCSELAEDPDYLDEVFLDGAISVNSFAPQTLDSAKVAMGFSRSK